MAADPSEADVSGSRKRAFRCFTVGMALVVAGVSGTLAVTSRHGGEPKPPPALSSTTVSRRDLETTATFKATVGFGAAEPVIGPGVGTVTHLPVAGSTVTRGHALYSIEDQPVVLLYGTAPLFRPLGPPDPSSAALRLQLDQAALLGAQQALNLAANHNETAIEVQQDGLGLSAARSRMTTAQQQLQTDQSVLTALRAACPATAGGSPGPGSTPPGDGTAPTVATGGPCSSRAADIAAVDSDQTALQSAQDNLEQTQLSIAAKRYVSPATLAQDRAAVAQAQNKVSADQATLDAASTPASGPDVATVAANLAALGDLPAALAGTSTWNGSLTDAVKQLQQSAGMTVTGSLSPQQVVIAPGPARVAAVAAHVGAPATGSLFSLTGTTEVISFTGTGDLRVGQPVTIAPGGTSPVKGRISTVTPDGAQLDVRVQPEQPGDLVAGTTVEVTVITARHAGVLSVPVEALLALAGGGYALQTPRGRLIPVDIGIISADQVEVSGVGVHPGLRVITAV